MRDFCLRRVKGAVSCLVIALLTVSCGSAASDQAEASDIEADTAGALFESVTPAACLAANQAEALMDIYDSVSVEIHYESDDTDERYYLTRDCAYFKSEFSETVMTDKDFCGFEESSKPEGGYFFRAVNASGKPFDVMDEVRVMDTETAREGHFSDMDIEGGELHVTSEVSSQRTMEVLDGENLLHDYEQGDEAVCYYTFDSATLALKEAKMVLREADGSERDIYIKRVYYGQAEPSAVEQILKRAGRVGDERRITLTLDAGTDKERVFTQSVSKGDRFLPLLPESYRLFWDRDGSVAYTGTSDLTEDIELFAMEATLSDFRAAGGVTAEELTEANRTGTLLARYGSFLRSLKTLPEESGYGADLYLDSTIYYASDSNGLEYVKNADNICMLSTDASGTVRIVKNVNEEGFHPSDEVYGLLSEQVPERESVIYAARHEADEDAPYNSALKVLTALSREDSVEQAEANGLDEEIFGEGDLFMEKYFVDADTLAILEDRSYIGTPNDTGDDIDGREYAVTKIIYGAEEPEGASALLEKALR